MFQEIKSHQVLAKRVYQESVCSVKEEVKEMACQKQVT